MNKPFRSVFFLILIFAASLAQAEVQVVVKPLTDPITVGSNKIEIQIRDEGKPVGDVLPRLTASMPAMGTMPYMEVPGDVVKKSDGQFVSEVELPMGGTWDITVTLEKDGNKSLFRYSATTEIPGLLDKNGSAPQAAPKDAGAAELRLSPDRLQRIGVRFVEATKSTMEKSIRSTGLLEADASRRSEVTLRFPAYVSKLSGKRLGEPVTKGEELALVESPELLAAQKEIVLALQLPGDGHLDRAVAAERLRALGMSESDVNAVMRSKQVLPAIRVRSPQNGTLIDASVREGSRADQGQVLFVISDLKTSYIVGKIFQQDMAFVKKGQRVDIIVPGMEDKRVAGVVDLVYPNVSEGAGTANVRIVPLTPLPLVQPGNYVQIKITVAWPADVVVPAEAVLYSGLHAYVFVDHGGGALSPTEVVLGRRTPTHIEILEGLAAGQRVAASGTFLLSSEANLRSALPKWRSAAGEKQ